MNIAFVDPLTRAWNRMTRILFQPFDFVKWLVLGFTAWLAGLVNGGGGGPWSGIHTDDMPHGPEVYHDLNRAFERILEHVILVPLVLLVAVLIVGLIVLLVWLSSRAKFMFLDNVINNRAVVVEPWNRFARLGNSLFLWRIGFGVVCIGIVVCILILMVGPAIGLAVSDGFGGVSLAAVILGGVLMFMFAIVAAYVSLFLESFVIPIMYKYEIKATEAWRYFLPWLTQRGAHFLLYGLFVLLLWVLFAVVFGVFCLLTCCIVLLPYVGTVLLLPVIVTYRLLSVEFLAQFDPGFDLFEPLARPDAATEPGSLPVGGD